MILRKIYKQKNLLTVLMASMLSLLSSCKNNTSSKLEKPSEQNIIKKKTLKVVCTTTMITDLVKTIGKDHIKTTGIMGVGVDPHLYKPTENDVSRFLNADIIFYNGIHLEGKLESLFEQLSRKKKPVVEISRALSGSNLISSKEFQGNYDPHMWFDIKNWIKCTKLIADELSLADPANKIKYQKNASAYITQLNKLKNDLTDKIQELPKSKRILVTAHDAFGYFSREFDFKVVGLQGLSTITEAGVKDVQRTAKFIISNKIKAIFVESSVPKQTVEALVASVKSKGHDLKIGGTLYSDALGAVDTPQGSYIGMYRYNVNTIVNALR